MAKSNKQSGNKYAHLSRPAAELDYHRYGPLTREEIIAKADEFLERCFRKQMQKVLIITGKGLHSQNGPVVKPILQDYMAGHRLVRSVAPARIDRGGQGALSVSLISQ